MSDKYTGERMNPLTMILAICCLIFRYCFDFYLLLDIYILCCLVYVTGKIIELEKQKSTTGGLRR